MRPKSVLGYRTKSSLDRIGDNDPKNQRVGTSGHKKWGPGACPWCSFPRLSSKKVGLPAVVGGPPGALRPKAGKGPAHPKGTQYHPSSTRDWKTTPPCGMMGSILL